MWTCNVCGERIGDQFDSCWRCAGDGGDQDIDEAASAPVFEETYESPEECALCGSRRVVPNAVLGDQGQYSNDQARVKVTANPKAFFFKGTARADVVAKLCCQCGHLEFRAVGNLEALWESHVQSIKPEL